MDMSGWFQSNGEGTSYYISDKDGKKVYSSGTLCPHTLSHQCWQNLKDGDYVLRITGALDNHAGEHSWSFCGKTGGTQQELVFTIMGNRCKPLVGLSKNQYCAEPNVMDKYLVTK